MTSRDLESEAARKQGRNDRLHLANLEAFQDETFPLTWNFLNLNMGPTILAVIDDLFFASKIRGTAEQMGAQALFAKSTAEAIEKARSHSPQLIVIDLHARGCDPIELARAFKTDHTLADIRLLGFFSHVEVELQRQAKQAGFDQTVPRSRFVEELQRILGEMN